MSNAMQTFSNLTANSIPTSLITEEISGIYGSQLLHELEELITLYQHYDEGIEFLTEGSNGDYIPSDLRYQRAASLINTEARFLFAKHPDIKVEIPYEAGNATAREAAQNAMTIYQHLLDKVIKENGFYSDLLKAAKDCFIGRRVAWFVNFNEQNERITIDFIPSMEFVAEYKEDAPDELKKIVTFYNLNDVSSRTEQRIYKKKYWLENDKCYISETIYDGTGAVVEEVIPPTATLFDFIPAGVIINDGLTGDIKGRSDLEKLLPYEQAYSRLANGDIDAERKSMNPVTYAIDMNPATTEGLSSAAGAFWDLQSDPNLAEGNKGNVGRLESTIAYSGALDTTLNRILSIMYDTVDVPNIDLSTMTGVLTSGKALKAIYWRLIVKSDEKMLAWKPAIERIARIIIDGSRLYPVAANRYLKDQILPDLEYNIFVDNQYPLPEDEAEEKATDLAQVQNKTMSIKSYIMKWSNKTSDEAEEEILQIARERQILEDSFLPDTGV